MSISLQQHHYEDLLASLSHHQRAVELLRHHRPYFEKIPSIRRSAESLIPIPLPIVKVRQRLSPSHKPSQDSPYELITFPCDLAFLMCDPEWQIKTDVEIFVFIHRPGEELSELLRRWRETQVLLSRGYSWEMPLRHQHIFSEGAEKLYPLFVLSPETSDRLRHGLKGACLPHVTMSAKADFAARESDETPLTAYANQPMAHLGSEAENLQTDFNSESDSP